MLNIGLVRALDSNIMVAYFLLNEDEFQLSYSIYSMLKQTIPELKKYKDGKGFIQRINNLGSDIEVMLNGRRMSDPDIKPFEEISKVDTMIPADFSSSLEHKISWITQQVIFNLFAYNAHEVGFAILMDITGYWPELYRVIIPNIQKLPIKNDLYNWLNLYASAAIDIFGVDEIRKSLEVK